MNGWRIRRGLSGDVPMFATALIIFGGVIATVARVLTDIVLHHHSTKVRQARTRESHRH